MSGMTADGLWVKDMILAMLDSSNPNHHIPSLTDDNEESIRNSAALLDPYDIEREPADLALRTCHCGMPIDGFYEYVDHLRSVINKEIN